MRQKVEFAFIGYLDKREVEGQNALCPIPPTLPAMTLQTNVAQKTERTCLRVAVQKAEYEQIKRLAAENNTNVSGAVRGLLRMLLEKPELLTQ